MYTMPKGPSSTCSFDLLFRGLEITTGGQRIHDQHLLMDNMRKKGLEPAILAYVHCFAMGMPPWWFGHRTGTSHNADPRSA